MGTLVRADDPPIDVNRKTFARDDLPRVLDGYDVALDDHSYMPTELVARCPQLKHIVFWHGRRQLHECRRTERARCEVHTIRATAIPQSPNTPSPIFAAPASRAHGSRVRSGVWTPQEGVQLLGKTLGVIGLGGIGAEVARFGKGLA